MKIVTFLIIGAFIWQGCATKHHANESLQIIELGRQSGPEYVYLPNDYGFLIYWFDDKEPELYIYDKPANRIKMTSDFSVFLSEIQHFPNGVKVDRIRGCAITAAGMPEEHKEQLNKLIKAKKFKLTGTDDDNYSICSCETIYVRRYKTTNNSVQRNKTDHFSMSRNRKSALAHTSDLK